MTDTIAHRGPDRRAIGLKRTLGWVTDDSHFDLRDHATQPMMSQCKRYIMVYNGEVYNYQELRLELIKLGRFSKQARIRRLS